MSRAGVDLAIEYLPTDTLIPCDSNARTHSAKQVQQIADSISVFGFNNPVLIDHHGRIIAGHGRVQAAKVLALSTVPTIRLGDLTEQQRRAYIIADNRLAEKAGWDPQILAIEFQHLSKLDIDFALEITGFETAEIDFMVESAATSTSDDCADAIPPVEPRSVSRDGDLWQLGAHRLLCGDARHKQVCSTLMGSERARLMFADPPYNVRIDGHAVGLGSTKHREFAMASGELTHGQFVEFLKSTFLNAVGFSMDGAIHYICIDWRHLNEMPEAGAAVYSELKNLCVWNKNNAGMGSFYRSKHELIFVWKVGKGSHINNIELGCSGRYRTNVWDYSGVNTFRRDRTKELSMHPTVKPVALVIDAIRDCSRRGDIVFDPFSGSGTTVIAAQKSGRIARAIEIDRLYVDVAIRRWQDLTGGKAIHVTSGRAFAEVADRRSSQENGQ